MFLLFILWELLLSFLFLRGVLFCIFFSLLKLFNSIAHKFYDDVTHILIFISHIPFSIFGRRIDWFEKNQCIKVNECVKVKKKKSVNSTVLILIQETKKGKSWGLFSHLVRVLQCQMCPIPLQFFSTCPTNTKADLFDFSLGL